MQKSTSTLWVIRILMTYFLGLPFGSLQSPTRGTTSTTAPHVQGTELSDGMSYSLTYSYMASRQTPTVKVAQRRLSSSIIPLHKIVIYYFFELFLVLHLSIWVAF